MTTLDTIKLELYDILFKLRYPDITKVKPDNIDSTILSGDNRIHLLTWLLTEKLPTLKIELAKLSGPVLIDKLANYYSELGISSNKDILLGNCTSDEQLSILIRLLKFIKKVYADSNDVATNKEEQTIENLLKIHLTQNNDDLPNVSKTITYSEAVKYYESLRKLDEPNLTFIENEDSIFTEIDEEQNNIEEEKNFVLQTEQLMDAYNCISSSSLSVEKNDNPAVTRMDKYFTTMPNEFELFMEMLRLKDEIPKLALPKTSKEINSNKNSFDSFIEDIMVPIVKLKDAY